jgi:hypothetical protein
MKSPCTATPTRCFCPRNAIWDLGEHHRYGLNFTDFYGTKYDFVHPLEPGHQTVADMVVFLLQRTLLGLLQRPVNEVDREEAKRRLPEPVFAGALWVAVAW